MHASLNRLLALAAFALAGVVHAPAALAQADTTELSNLAGVPTASTPSAEATRKPERRNGSSASLKT